MIVHKARYKSGRAWIAAILDGATRVTKIEIDNITDERTQSTISIELLRKFVEIDGRDATVYELRANEFIYMHGAASHRYVTKYVIHTYAFDVSDLPGMERTK